MDGPTTRAARRTHGDLRIRAARAWTREHGDEAPHLQLLASDRAELGRIAEVIEYRTAGSRVFSYGEAANFLYLLVDGLVASSLSLDNGERQIVAFYWPGDLFGLAEDGHYVNTAEILTPSTVYRFPIRQLERFLIDHPRIQHGFFIKAVHDLRATQRQLLVMGRFDVSRRLAAFLLDCSGHDDYFDQPTRVLALPMTRYDIADYLGTSAESITRAFGLLEGQGLLRRRTAKAVELTEKLKTYVEM